MVCRVLRLGSPPRGCTFFGCPGQIDLKPHVACDKAWSPTGIVERRRGTKNVGSGVRTSGDSQRLEAR